MELKELSLLKQNECSVMSKTAVRSEGAPIPSSDMESLFHSCD